MDGFYNLSFEDVKNLVLTVGKEEGCWMAEFVDCPQCGDYLSVCKCKNNAELLDELDCVREKVFEQ